MTENIDNQPTEEQNSTLLSTRNSTRTGSLMFTRTVIALLAVVSLFSFTGSMENAPVQAAEHATAADGTEEGDTDFPPCC
ncbi:hypothetical protein ACFYY1_34925 [Streptomyces sp. NPDC001890]|uniref:hypothetical protein n=1 Tax=Streptomyces sp. NPDC001890 TaxID=3364620 RepID=UPI0036A6942A